MAAHSSGIRKPVIKANCIKSFLDTAVEVWEQELQGALAFREAEAVTVIFETDGFTAAVSLRGRLTGDVFYEFPEATVSAVNARESDDGRSTDEAGLAAMQRIAGMMSAAASDRLRESGYASEFGKLLLMRAGATIAIKQAQIRAHFEGPFGRMTIRIEVSETTDVATGG